MHRGTRRVFPSCVVSRQLLWTRLLLLHDSRLRSAPGTLCGRRPSSAGSEGKAMRQGWCLVFCCVVPCALASGCAEFWDNVTSRDFTVGSLFTRGPAPLQVLK